MKYLFISIFSFFMLLFLSACNGDRDKNQKRPVDQKQMEKSLVYANKQAVKLENEQIEAFIRRHNWQMKETGSGLRYSVYFEGNGPKAESGMIAVLKYSVSLIDGSEIYSSDKSGLKEFEIGRGGVESGLEEGILLMRVGDRAKFIIPSHLAFGLLGDQDKVPPKSTLIYDLGLVALK